MANLNGKTGLIYFVAKLVFVYTLEIDMKKIGCALLGLMMMASVNAAELKLNWGDVKKFTDVVTTEVSQDDFETHLKKEFSKMIAKQSKRLPATQTLEMTVTDIDLAGHVPPEMMPAGRMMRVVKDPYWPRMSFEYVLKDKEGKVLASGKEDLKDMSFLSGMRKNNQNSEFYFEEIMFNNWFKSMLKDKNFNL